MTVERFQNVFIHSRNHYWASTMYQALFWEAQRTTNSGWRVEFKKQEGWPKLSAWSLAQHHLFNLMTLLTDVPHQPKTKTQRSGNTAFNKEKGQEDAKNDSKQESQDDSHASLTRQKEGHPQEKICNRPPWIKTLSLQKIVVRSYG